MHRRRLLTSLGLAGLLLVALVPSPASAHDVNLKAHLTADQEVPKKGPGGAWGHATAKVNGDTGAVCFEVAYTGPGTVTAGHIHRGAAGVAGPVVVDLKVMSNSHKACVQGEAAVVQEIESSPQGFYVNLHTAAYSGGAVRGQLEPA